MQKNILSIYSVIDAVSAHIKAGSVVVCDAGSSFFATTQALRIPRDARLITSGGQADMGFCLPACIGLSYATKNEIIGIVGDGSFQLNIQELAFMAGKSIKLIVINNGGYLTIRNTQNRICGGRNIGVDLPMPNIEDIAKAYKIKYRLFDGVIFGEDCPVIYEAITDPKEQLRPSIM